MLVIMADTARFYGPGWFTCSICNSKTPVYNLKAVLLSLPHATVLYDAPTGTILHDCRHIRTLASTDHR